MIDLNKINNKILNFKTIQINKMNFIINKTNNIRKTRNNKKLK